MIYYNEKKHCYYELKKILVIGHVSFVIKTIIDYGFSKQIIQIDNGNKILENENKPLIVAETIPIDWNGETVSVKNFSTIMDRRKIELRKIDSLQSTAINSYAVNAGTCGGCGQPQNYNAFGTGKKQKK
jgi:hypothetical protein